MLLFDFDPFRLTSSSPLGGGMSDIEASRAKYVQFGCSPAAPGTRGEKVDKINNLKSKNNFKQHQIQ
jgi:hypothetical protein